jgi:hypothetical protein
VYWGPTPNVYLCLFAGYTVSKTSNLITTMRVEHFGC